MKALKLSYFISHSRNQKFHKNDYEIKCMSEESKKKTVLCINKSDPNERLYDDIFHRCFQFCFNDFFFIFHIHIERSFFAHKTRMRLITCVWGVCVLKIHCICIKSSKLISFEWHKFALQKRNKIKKLRNERYWFGGSLPDAFVYPFREFY